MEIRTSMIRQIAPDDKAGGTPPADALAFLRGLALDLRTRGTDPFDIATELAVGLIRLGVNGTSGQALVRELPGLESYDHLAEWQRRCQAEGNGPSLVEGL
jgi:hypothetical protein